jgi:molecular chaperone GrpE
MSTEPSKKNAKETKDKNKNSVSREQYHELEDKYRRALAEQQNLIKQHQKDRAHYVHYANEQLLLEILPVYDNLKLSCRHFNPDNTASWLEGINYIIKQFQNILNQQGVKEIPTIGQPFNHATMDAAEIVETTEDQQDDLVAEEIKPGYQLEEKVITPARVKVYRFKK